MKYVKVFILCLSLFHLQVFQGQLAYGQDPTPTPSSNNQGTGVNPGSFMEADESVHENRPSDEVKNPSLTSSHIFTALQMIVIGAMAPNIISLCGDQKSTYVYGAGALYYVAMEIINMGEFKKGSEQEMVYYTDGDHDKQIEALNAAADETEKAAKAAHKKADLSRNAAIVYAVAAIVALAEGMEWFGLNSACKGSTASLDIFQNNSQKFTQCNENSFPDYVAFSDGEKYFSSKEDIQLNPEPGIELMSKHVAKAKEEDKSAMEKALNLLFPEAQANKGTISGLVGGVAAAILVVTVLKEAMTKLLQASFAPNGFMRAGWYAGFGAIGLIASGQIRKAADDLDDRADQYRELAKRLQHHSEGIKLEGGSQAINMAFAKKSIRDTEVAEEKNACFTGTPGNLARDPDCLCKKANNCKKAEIPTLNLGEFGGGGIVSEPLSMFGNSANSLYSGDLTGAQTASAGLGSFAGRLGKARRVMMDKFNKKQKAAGKPTFDLENHSKNAQKAFSKLLQKGIQSLSPEQAKALTNMAPPKPSGKKKDKKVAGKKKATGVVAGQAAPQGNKQGGFGFSLDDDEEGEIAEGGIIPDDLAANMDSADMFEGDISDRADEDIFKIITTRYLKSYGKIFEESADLAPQTE